ncbi:MAG TPA: grasp-with-spasm system ATP-grasp peptide maturase [Thermoanaerobaculia bacterium]
MILIFSTQDWERTTEDVMDWIRALGGQCFRINGEDLIGGEDYALRLARDSSEARFTIDGKEIPVSEVDAVWYRRGGRFSEYTVYAHVPDHEVAVQLDSHLRAEMQSTAGALYALLADKPWLTRPAEARINKMNALRTAAEVGFDVPATLITSSRDELEAFFRKHGRIITKAISDGTAFYVNDKRCVTFTEEVSGADIAALPERFLPTLAQELLEKKYELRIFYLAGRCYPAAIFSQADPRTQIDFRHYNTKKPNRNVPYRLEPEVEDRIRQLMKALGLTTGSLDFVRTADDRLVFLEVNPVGQFGMISGLCNYNIEKDVADHLLSLGQSAGGATQGGHP